MWLGPGLLWWEEEQEMLQEMWKAGRAHRGEALEDRGRCLTLFCEQREAGGGFKQRCNSISFFFFF